MTFLRAPCTERLFEQLRLPASLRDSKQLNPVGHDLVHDPVACAALITHPFVYSEYPDRGLSFYVRGQEFGGWEYCDPDRVEVWVESGVDEATYDEVARLLVSAVAVLRNETPGSVPVVLHRK